MSSQAVTCSVVLNAHKDAPWLTAAFHSIDASIQRATTAGISCELVAVLDAPDPRTAELLQHLAQVERNYTFSLVWVEHRSLGMARNSGINAACGKYIITADADDLFGESYIEKMVHAAETVEFKNFALYPEFILSFGSRAFLARYASSFYFSPADMLVNNPFCSRLIAPRDTLLKFPYGDFGLTSPWSFEDWELTLRLAAEGAMLGVCEKAVLFYRERENSLAKQAHAQGGLVRASRFHAPEFLIERHQNFLGRFSSVRYLEQTRARFHDRDATLAMLEPDHWFAVEVEGANRLEPQISLRKAITNTPWCPLPYHTSDQNWGWCLIKVLEQIGKTPVTDVILLTNLDPGGAERYLLNIAKAFHHHHPQTRVLMLADTPDSTDLWAEKLPTFIQFINLGKRFGKLGPTECVEIAARVLQILAAKASDPLRIHLKPSPFAHNVALTYGRALSAVTKLLYYRFSNPVELHDGSIYEDPFATEFLQRAGPFLSGLICDNQAIIEKDCRMLDATARGYIFLPALLGDFETPVHPVEIASPREDCPPSMRLLWASRLSREKRLSLLGPLARSLEVDLPGVVIECRGSGDELTLGRERPANLLYLGGFDSPLELQFENYDAFLYTSLYDGMPNIVVEALSQGSVVIASDVGSISHYIKDGLSGYLIKQTGDDFVDATRFAQAVKDLYQNWSRKTQMQEAAVASIRTHDIESYLRHTAEILTKLASGGCLAWSESSRA